jgi:hypothetical protein
VLARPYVNLLRPPPPLLPHSICAGCREGEVSDRLWFVTSARLRSLLYPLKACGG